MEGKTRVFRALTMVLVAALLRLSNGWTNNNKNIRIAPPRTLREWKQLAEIEVDAFDDNFGWWEWRERKATEKSVRQHYVETAERLRGKKYALLIAIDTTLRNQVVGMVEMGVSCNGSGTETTIGVLAVAPKGRRQGIGAKLLERCEQVATSEGWNETKIYVEVEPNNTAALRFFEQKHGFVRLNETRTVLVRQRQQYRERPHLLLSKELCSES